jgi:D-alanyl-D-alanine carboxypeptidase
MINALRLYALLVAAWSAPTLAPAQTLPDDSLVSCARRMLAVRAAADSFSGAIILARNGKTLLREAYGFADRDARAPNRPETKFNLGSVDKLITRIALWQLVAAGKLALDEPVGRYLPDYPNRDVRERVTARQLIDMSSGVGNFYNDAYLQRHAAVRSVDDYLSLFAANPLQFEPGSSRAYSNGGYIVLGKIIERLSGQTYYDYIRDRITGPTGMADTRHYLIDERVPNRAIGYTSQDPSLPGPGSGAPRPRLPNSWSLAGRGSPAGGGYSTVDDFLKLDAAIRQGRLLPAPFIDSLFPNGFRAGATPLRYGGGGPGANAEYVAFADGYTIIVFSNYDPSGATQVMQEIARLLGKSVPSGPTLRMRRPG